MANLLGNFSRFYKAADLRDAPVRHKIKSVALENVAPDGAPESRKIVARFEGHDKALIVNKTNYELITDIFESPDTDDWIGGEIELYFDPTVMHMGERKGGVRVRA